MSETEPLPPLKQLHPDSALNAGKLAFFDRLATGVLLESLVPGRDQGCLKTRRDGTILDGHHRIYILRRRGIDVDRSSARDYRQGSSCRRCRRNSIGLVGLGQGV